MRRCLTCGGKFDRRRLICPADKDILADEGVPTHETGSVLGGRYRLGNLLGEGGMGKVFEAARLDSGEVVAIKLLKTNIADPKVRTAAEKRFHLEADAAGSLDHPGVAKIFEFAKTPDGGAFIALERLYGATFGELRRAGKLASLERVVELMREVSEVIALAHQKGIVHRDLKPSNIFLHRIDKDRSQVKVLDFGIAKFLDRPGERLTSTGEFLGTLLYMPPEQSGGQPATTAMDVYSLGVILFEMLAGTVPFAARNPLELLRLHASMPAPSIASFRPDASAELEEVVARCLRKKPEHRYANGGELARALASIKAVRSASDTEGSTSTFHSSAAWWVGTVVDERYELQEWIAPARFGSDVYRAVHLHTGATVAVRLWRTGQGAVRDCLLDAFKREARAMAVHHSNLISIIDLGFNDECVYLVTELVESLSLRTLIARKGSLPPGLGAELIRGAGNALHALHEKGIVSGGLSPETIRVTGSLEKPEKLLISPFGLSNLRQVRSLLPTIELVEGGDRSLDYISPEQKLGLEPDVRSDVYSLAMVLAEMLGGQILRQVDPARPTATERRDDLQGPSPEEAVLSVPADMPREWVAVLWRATDASRERRFASIPEFLSAMPPT
jgi:serine/threonine protein kinase